LFLEVLLPIANGDVSPNATLAQRLRQKEVRGFEQLYDRPFAHCLPPAAAYRATGRDGRRGRLRTFSSSSGARPVNIAIPQCEEQLDEKRDGEKVRADGAP